MDQHIESYLLTLSKRDFARHILTLIKTKDYPAFLFLTSSLLKYPTQQGALIPIYPKIANFSKKIWLSEIEEFPLKTTINTVLNNISVGYINHIGCNCGKKIDPLYLPNEIVNHMTCDCFVKNIMSHLPTILRKKFIFYLDSDYDCILARKKELRLKNGFQKHSKV